MFLLKAEAASIFPVAYESLSLATFDNKNRDGSNIGSCGNVKSSGQIWTSITYCLIAIV